MDTGKSIMTFLAGAAAGAVAALLLAPDSGSSIRAKAADAAGTAKEKLLEGLDAIEAALEEE